MDALENVLGLTMGRTRYAREGGSERRAIYSPIVWPTAHCFTPGNL
jgi:hypothetical protein